MKTHAALFVGVMLACVTGCHDDPVQPGPLPPDWAEITSIKMNPAPTQNDPKEFFHFATTGRNYPEDVLFMGHQAKFYLMAGSKVVDIKGAQIEVLAYAEASAPCSITQTDLWGCNNDNWNQPPGLGTVNGIRCPGPGKHMILNLPSSRNGMDINLLLDRRKDPANPGAGMYKPFERRNTAIVTIALRLRVEKDRYVYGGCGWYMPMLISCNDAITCGYFYEVPNTKPQWDVYEAQHPPGQNRLLDAGLPPAPWACGDACTVFDDPDRDALPSCYDQCPADFYKIVPGACGCGVSDIDTDKDGVADCVDPCPTIGYGLPPCQR